MRRVNSVTPDARPLRLGDEASLLGLMPHSTSNWLLGELRMFARSRRDCVHQGTPYGRRWETYDQGWSVAQQTCGATHVLSTCQISRIVERSILNKTYRLSDFHTIGDEVLGVRHIVAVVNRNLLGVNRWVVAQ